MSQAAYERIIRQAAARLEKATAALERTGDVDRFAAEFIDTLDQVHLGAVYQGRVLAGVSGQIEEDDRILARELADRHATFAESFLDDIDRGRYGEPGSYSAGGIRFRLSMYLDTARGTANESFVVNSDPADTWRWVLGIAEHCEDCLTLAELSPLRSDELWTYPGSGETDCRSKCRCHLKRLSDGKDGFTRLETYAMLGGPVHAQPGEPSQWAASA
jgi:hypothetical protein